jgi:SAM-dependent methyltransferase
MQSYNPGFARIYNTHWIDFAERVAPLIRTFYEHTPIGQTDHTLLDVCCGTGQLAHHFLEHGYHVTGIDLSPPMLAYARDNNAPYVEHGQARFIQADAVDLNIEGIFGLAVSTFDALNHLPGGEALRACFESVYSLLRPQGFFIFDLNTRAGLHRWNGINVRDLGDALIIDRGIYDETEGQAWIKITGFMRLEDGRYERFDQTAYNMAYDLDWVRDTLCEVGFRSAYYARADDLSMPLVDAEAQKRVFFVART